MIPGQLLGERYEILRELGRSAAGATYQAADTPDGSCRRRQAPPPRAGRRLEIRRALRTGSGGPEDAASREDPPLCGFLPCGDRRGSRFVLVREYYRGPGPPGDGGHRVGTARRSRSGGIGRSSSTLSRTSTVSGRRSSTGTQSPQFVVRADGESSLVDFGGGRRNPAPPRRHATTTLRGLMSGG